VSEGLLIDPISCKFSILKVERNGISQVGSCNYEVSQSDDLIGVSMSSTILLPWGKCFEKKELQMSIADFTPISFTAFLDGPSVRTLIKSDYGLPSSLSYIHPLNLDFSSAISVGITHISRDPEGRVAERRFIVEKRPFIMDSLSILELVRYMAAAGQPTERRIMFDGASGVYLDCYISYFPEDRFDEPADCICYSVRLCNRKLGISLDEELYFDNSPPFVLLRHRLWRYRNGPSENQLWTHEEPL
jgi:hypothetical protein